MDIDDNNKYMMLKYLTKMLLLLIILLISGSFKSINAQHKGQLIVSFGIGIPCKGVLAIKYFPIDNYAIEIFAGGIPGLFNYEAAIHHYFDARRPNTYVQIGIAKIIGEGEGIGVPYGKEDEFARKDTFVTKSISNIGINLGIGREFIADSNKFYFAFGPTYILKRKIAKYNYFKKEQVEAVDDSLKWFGFIEGGINAYLNKKND